MPDTQLAGDEFQPKVDALVATAEQFVIANDDDYRVAAEELKAVSYLHKEIAAYFKPLVQKAHEAHKAIKAKENEALNPLKEAKRTLSQRMGDYQAKLERERREEERRLQEEQRRIDEEERLKRAEALEAAGKQDAAEQALATPTYERPVKVDSNVPKVEGTQRRTKWRWEVEDASKLPDEYTLRVPHEAKIEVEVQAKKDATDIAGVRVWADTKVYTRG